MNRLALFDCDGTLVDSGATIHRALADSFTRNGIAVPRVEDSRRVIGLSLTEAMAALLPGHAADTHEALVGEYKRSFVALRTAGEVEEPLFEGIVDLLDSLEADGWLLGVATGKSDRGLRHCLEHHGLADRFVTLQTADRHPSKPHPSMAHEAMAEAGSSPATTIMIGDTSFDMQMARNAGMCAIGVAWGYHDREELMAIGADAVAQQPSELLAIMKDLALG